jgi:hypothetical protein
VCEDDVVLPPSYEGDISVVLDYLDSIEHTWDVFVGLTADFYHNTRISKVQEFKDRRFIHCNKFTSTVLNIYSRAGLQKFASWAFDGSIGQENTIDRFLNRDPNLRVITLDKNICGHDIESSSTIWGHSNAEYGSMIARSQYIRSGLMHEWLEGPKVNSD